VRGGIRESADACIGKILFALASSRSQRAVVSNETAHSEEIGPRGDHEAEPVADETQASPNERASTKSGNPTSDADAPAKTDSGQPVENPRRQLWVTETALATALNMGYLAENITMFGIVVGIALVLTGIGFLVLTLGGALRSREADSAAAVRGTPATV
jgi:hypothetical protein